MRTNKLLSIVDINNRNLSNRYVPATFFSRGRSSSDLESRWSALLADPYSPTPMLAQKRRVH